MDNHNYLELAINAAKTSGEILIGNFATVKDFNIKNGNIRDVVTEVDLLSEKNIINIIKAQFPDHMIVGEEMGTTGNSSGGYVWYIDPIDGTVNYSQGIELCVVSIALIKGGKPIVGVIYNPFSQELYYAERGQGAYKNDSIIDVGDKASCRDCLFIAGFSSEKSKDKKDEYQVFGQINDSSRGALRLGSAALALAYLAEGKIDGFWIVEPKVWDVAAGILIASEAGALVSDFNGQEISVQAKNICASSEKIHQEFLSYLEPIKR